MTGRKKPVCALLDANNGSQSMFAQVQIANRTQEKRMASCDGKHPFADFGIANQVAKRQNRNNDRAKVQVYRCPHCSQYHIGKRRRSGP